MTVVGLQTGPVAGNSAVASEGAVVQPGADAADNPRLRKAAADFETMAVGELLQPVFGEGDADDQIFGGGAAERMFRPMLVEQMAKSVGRAGGLGLSEIVYRQMLQAQEGKK